MNGEKCEATTDKKSYLRMAREMAVKTTDNHASTFSMMRYTMTFADGSQITCRHSDYIRAK